MRPRAAGGFHLLPRRWVLERNFASLGRNRRLAKDVQKLVDTSSAIAITRAVDVLAMFVRPWQQSGPSQTAR